MHMLEKKNNFVFLHKMFVFKHQLCDDKVSVFIENTIISSFFVL